MCQTVVFKLFDLQLLLHTVNCWFCTQTILTLVTPFYCSTGLEGEAQIFSEHSFQNNENSPHVSTNNTFSGKTTILSKNLMIRLASFTVPYWHVSCNSSHSVVCSMVYKESIILHSHEVWKYKRFLISILYHCDVLLKYNTTIYHS